MGTTTTTTTEVNQETTTTTTEVKSDETTTTTTEVKKSETGNPAGNSSDNTNVPTREESLKAAGKASPHAPDAGIEDGTQVLGSEGQSTEDLQHEVRREAAVNAKADAGRLHA